MAHTTALPDDLAFYELRDSFHRGPLLFIGGDRCLQLRGEINGSVSKLNATSGWNRAVFFVHMVLSAAFSSSTRWMLPTTFSFGRPLSCAVQYGVFRSLRVSCLSRTGGAEHAWLVAETTSAATMMRKLADYHIIA